MEQTVLYHLLQQAKKENKAVQLLTNNSKRDWDVNLIIEPNHEICNEEHNIISCDGCLIDLNFIVCAVLIPNKEERLKKEKEIWDKAYEEVYKANPKGRR